MLLVLVFFSYEGIGQTNLVENSDFNYGGNNPSQMYFFNSDYTFSADHTAPPNLPSDFITVLTSAYQANNQWIQYGAGGTGNFLICDGTYN